MDKSVNIAVVGATGVVGKEILGLLSERGHPADKVTALASERSAGTEVDYADDSLEVEQATAEALRGMRAVLFAAPADVVKRLAPAAQAAGAWVVDVSPAYLTDIHVPVVVPDVNGAALDRPSAGRMIRCPSPVTTALALVLEPLRAAYGLSQVSVTALLGASSGGLRGMTELEQQTAGLLSGRDVEPALFPHRLGFNVVPQVGEFVGATTAEELGWRTDLMRIWAGQSAAPLDGTALLIPTFFGHSLSLTVKLAKGTEAKDVRETLRRSPALKLLDSPGDKVYPMPLLVTADPTVHVGRVRSFAGLLDTFSLFAVIDNAGRGAALNAVETATRLVLKP